LGTVVVVTVVVETAVVVTVEVVEDVEVVEVTAASVEVSAGTVLPEHPGSIQPAAKINPIMILFI